MKSHLNKNHKDLHSQYLSNVADCNNVVNPAKKVKQEESRAKMLDRLRFQSTLAAFQKRHAIFGNSGLTTKL